MSRMPESNVLFDVLVRTFLVYSQRLHGDLDLLRRLRALVVALFAGGDVRGFERNGVLPFDAL